MRPLFFHYKRGGLIKEGWSGLIRVGYCADSHSTLPNPPAQVMNKIQDMFYKFLWDGKPDKIKRNVIINNYEEGGIKLPHIESFCKVLKMSWLYKLLDPMNMSLWKILLLSYIEK